MATRPSASDPSASDSASTSPPVRREKHPLYRREYRVATPSIEQFWLLVQRCLTRRIPGALIYAHPRFGKTHAIQYLRLLLQREFPTVCTYHVQAEFKPNHTEGAFFTNLMQAVHVPTSWGHTSNAAKRNLLREKIIEHAHRAQGNWVVFFVDEAQRFDKNEYEWLRDIHDALNHYDIRMFVFLVGQPQLLAQKIKLREAGEAQIVLRFMVEDVQFRGIQSAEDAAVTLQGYDKTEFPEGSGWSYTRFCYPKAFGAGYRLVNDARALWNAFARVHDDEKFPGKPEIPMDNFSRAVEYLLLEAPVKDDDDFTIPSAVISKAVTESLYVPAMQAHCASMQTD